MKFQLESEFKPSGDQPQAIKGLVDGLKKGERFQTLLGVTGSGKTFTMANVIAQVQKPTLVIAPNKTLAAQLYQEYKAFFPNNKVCYFVSYYDYYQPEAYLPVTDTYIEKEAMINEQIDRYRHVATSSLLTRSDVIVVASVSCIYNLGVPENYFDSVIGLDIGRMISRSALIKWLVKIGFTRNNVGQKRGTFRVVGDVFEVYPASEQIAYRIGLEGNKVIDLAVVDAVSRKVIEELRDLIIFPPKHFVTTLPERERALKDIKAELKERLVHLNKNGLLLEAERLERRTKYDIEMIATLGFCHGIENYSRHLSGKPPGSPPDTLMAYFPRRPKGAAKPRQGSQSEGGPNETEPDFLTIIDESHIAVPQVRGMYAGDQARKKVLVEFGWRLPSALDNRPLNFKEFEERVGQVIFTSATPAEYEREHSTKVLEQIVRPTGLVDPPIEVRPVFDREKNLSQVDDVMEEAIATTKKGERSLVITLTKKMAEELAGFLNEKGFQAKFMHSDTKTFERTKILEEFRRGDFDVLVGVNLLREGLDLPEVSLVAILDADREGFLRSEVSLIQTMGRAARNVGGRAILYADQMTGSIKRAISECERRRKIQLAYNKKHKITPQSTKSTIKEFD
ncbi:MAG: excinuclease ABC subunit UvrB [Candidatus Harrisonbacteria bacterium CG10_big_fil_rev_8_21_14_0_10_49_15]|uniref:Excinuclease ABC subunit UvrB n=1 Tax=Candidatus Harrisonbacteria bacterium CG10_big_fil_rev_8_21_14_0_10_49_15 TaxID=1974587 RepID=A0A2H0UMZ3_9BACT|nr:MAG: excinuclease ABC subunit UvrB [Candidatus Harrisonbacteria bacterium CG10_big_fil_rev_8_21_14_0_10_49_15]